MTTSRLEYQRADSRQTLGDALREYHTQIPDLLDPAELEPDAADLFRSHDVAHVVFGCDTSLHDEILIDTWTVAATDVGLRTYASYVKTPAARSVIAHVSVWTIIVSVLTAIPDVIRVLLRARRMTRRWPWSDHAPYLDRPLADIRREFGIRVLDLSRARAH